MHSHFNFEKAGHVASSWEQDMLLLKEGFIKVLVGSQKPWRTMYQLLCIGIPVGFSLGEVITLPFLPLSFSCVLCKTVVLSGC